MGGLWRHRGRAPNRLVGIGMAGQGTNLKSPGYAITPAGRDGKDAWMFDGVAGDVFGASGFAMGSAAGDEVDRFDVRRVLRRMLAWWRRPRSWVITTRSPSKT